MKAVVLGLMAMVPILYAGGYLSQFIENYNAWRRLGGVPGDGTAPAFPEKGLLVCLSAALSPSGLKAVLFITSAVVCITGMALFVGRGEKGDYDEERKFHYSQKGTYGTARYMDIRKMKELLEVKSIRQTEGIILGTVGRNVVSIPVDSRMNRNIAVFGASGSMKSRAFVRNMIFQSVKRGESLILTDPKSELYEDMAIYLQEQGYTVRVFNLIHPEHSDRWNCLGEVAHDQMMAQVCADVIIKNTSSGKTDHFWDMSELNLLKALILYVDYEKAPSDRNMGEVYRMLSALTESELDNRFDILPNGHPAKAPYNIFKQAGDKVRGGVIVGLGARLQVFQNESICKITAQDEFGLSRPGREKCAFFCISSDQDSTFDFLSSLFFSFLFIKLVRYADGEGIDGKLPVGVNFVMDEFPNLGVINDFKKKISTVRSRNIGISVIFQNIAQLKNRYPNDEYLEILGNCDTQIALGCTDEMTAKFISNRTGDVTIDVSSQSKHLHTWRMTDYTPDYKETSSVGRRKLMTADEVLRMPLEEALIILRGQNVFKVRKFDYTKHPESRKLKKRKAVEYIPAWRKAEEMPVNIGFHKTEGLPEPKRKAEEKVPSRKEFISISKQELMSKKKEENKNGK